MSGRLGGAKLRWVVRRKWRFRERRLRGRLSLKGRARSLTARRAAA
jgi:hypothetical protein